MVNGVKESTDQVTLPTEAKARLGVLLSQRNALDREITGFLDGLRLGLGLDGEWTVNIAAGTLNRKES